MEEKVIQIHHMHIGYGDRTLCEGISFEIISGECILLAGANGSGKTTLLKTLAASCRERAVMIPTGIPKVKGFTLEQFIRTGCYRESSWRGRLGKEAETRLQEALELLEVRKLAAQDISTLSDGEFQKGCIASALTRNADLLLLDEPTAYLDVENRMAVLKALRKVTRRKGISILFSSHDIHEAVQVADRVFAFTPDRRFLTSTSESASKLATLQASLRTRIA